MNCRGLLNQRATLTRVRGAVFAAAAAAAVVLAGPAAQAEDADISLRRSLERTSFTNEEIIDGFFKIAFGAELELGQPAQRIRKFGEPVRVFVVQEGKHDRRADVAAVLADIGSHIDHLDLALTGDRRAANFVVRLVESRDLKRTIRSAYGRQRARQIQRSLDPQCLSGIGKDERYRIRRAEVILPNDVAEFAFYDCAYEELLQALGAINDDRSVPWSMFNDDVQMGFFDVYDQHLLNILYDPRIQPGMTKEQVSRLLPDVLPTVRAWVARTNPLRATDARGSSDAAFRAPTHY